ncbi:hypothetical protein H5410_062066 [Solanum commersonii]|uniref:Uncharacterized protein n=1 Tax=Solanum commersonii TaxID=4109 RepID=A0A9J5WAJ5_SOLCO|nr:hypothetical protein H5410_062066 [Solanum commersonii]
MSRFPMNCNDEQKLIQEFKKQNEHRSKRLKKSIIDSSVEWIFPTLLDWSWSPNPAGLVSMHNEIPNPFFPLLKNWLVLLRIGLCNGR